MTLSVTRQVTPRLTLDLRYIGTLARKQQGSIELNTNNVYHNPELFQALTDARAGKCTPSGYPNYTAQGIDPCDIAGDPVILDQLFAGLNINNSVPGFGPVGTINSTGVFQSGAEQMRRNATFQNNLSWGDFNNVTTSLIGLNALTPQQGRQAPAVDAATGSALSGIAQVALRNGCDRIANGFTIVQQTSAGGPQVANTGTGIPLRCFPEDWLTRNPQFSSITYNGNYGHTNYRNLNFTAQAQNTHQFRMNGTVELPIGPNKMFFGNTSGLVGHLLERWQTSFIFNAATGTPTTLNPGQSHLYSPSWYQIASPNWVNPKPHVHWNTNTGSMYPTNAYVGVTDPQCSDPSVVTQGDRMGTNMGVSTTPGVASVCTILAVAKGNPDGTPGEVLLKYPMPGQTGNLGQNTIKYFGQWSLDMNASKTIKFAENRSFQIRIDATNVLNHPVPDFPTLNAQGLGAINGKAPDQFNTAYNARQLQGQLRINF